MADPGGSSRSTSPRSTPRSRKRSTAKSPDRFSTARCSSASGRVRDRSGVPPCGAALDPIRVLAGHRARGQRRRHVEAAGVRPARGGIARPAGRLPVSVVDCGVRPPGTDAKRNAGRVREDQWALPTTMCGCNKLYCEQIGRYYAPLQTTGGRVPHRPRGLRALNSPA